MARAHILGEQPVPTIGETRLDWSNVGCMRYEDGAYGMGSRCANCLVALSVIVPGCATDDAREDAHSRFDELRMEHQRVCPALGQADVFGSGPRA